MDGEGGEPQEGQGDECLGASLWTVAWLRLEAAEGSEQEEEEIILSVEEAYPHLCFAPRLKVRRHSCDREEFLEETEKEPTCCCCPVSLAWPL